MIDYKHAIVGAQIKLYRLNRNYSQKKLAELTGLSVSYISELEGSRKSAEHSVSMNNISKIAEVLGVSLDELASTNLEYRPNFKNNNLIEKYKAEMATLDLEDLLYLKESIKIFSSN